MDIKKLDDKDLWQLIIKKGKEAVLSKRQFMCLLPEAQVRALYKKHNFYTIYHMASVVGGVSQSVTYEFLRVNRKLRKAPKLQRLLLSAKIGYSKFRPILAIITKETQDFWVDKIKTLTKRELELFVREGIEKRLFVEQSEASSLTGTNSRPIYGTRKPFLVPLSDKTINRLNVFKKQMSKTGPANWEKVITKLLDNSTLKTKQKPPRKPRKETKQVSNYKKYQLESEFHGMCAYPNCRNPYSDFHHVTRQANKKDNENVWPVCKVHHSLIHHGLVKYENLHPSKWQIRKDSKYTKSNERIDKAYQYIKANVVI